jgi:pteridine reductase
VKREIADQTILITGAGTRVGAQIAQTLSSRGYRLVLHYNHSKPILKTNAQISHVRADLSKISGPQKILNFLKKNKIKINVAVLNAANFLNGKVIDTDQKTWNQSLNVNLRSNFFLSQSLIAQKIEHLIFIGDSRVEKPYGGKAAYLISKTGIHALIKILAKELPESVRVHGIAPGIVLFPKSYSPQLRKKALKNAGLKKEAGAERVSKTILKLINNKKIPNGKIIKVG